MLIQCFHADGEIVIRVGKNASLVGRAKLPFTEEYRVSSFAAALLRQGWSFRPFLAGFGWVAEKK